MFPSRRATIGGDVFRDEFSLAFDGTNDHVLTDFKPDYIHTNATFAMWVKMNDLVGTQTMGCHSNKRWYFGFSSNKAFIGVANQNKNNIIITPTPVAGEWLHYACTAIDGTATVYINGVAMADTMSYTQNSGHNPVDGFTMGARNTSTLGNGEDIILEAYMNANISEVVQYDKGLSASEVKTLYNGREPYNHKEGVCSSNLQAWWRMGDGVLDDRNGLVADQTNATLTSNVVVNGEFDTDSDWTKGTGWSINNGEAIFTGSDFANLTPASSPLESGKNYKITLDATVTNGSFKLQHNSVDIITGNTTGSFTAYFTSSNTTFNIARASVGVQNDFTVDNIVIKKINGKSGIMTNMDTNDFEGDTP